MMDSIKENGIYPLKQENIMELGHLNSVNLINVTLAGYIKDTPVRNASRRTIILHAHSMTKI
jgi:hypothetical protein